MSYVIPIGGFLLVICLASWQVGEWVSRLVSPVARDGNIIQISWPALARANTSLSLATLVKVEDNAINWLSAQCFESFTAI